MGGLLWYLYQGVKLGIYPPLIFLGVGAMTDFGPLIANPKTLLLGAAAQLGIFTTFIGALALGFNPQEAASIGIIGGADGPTAIYLDLEARPAPAGAHRRGRLLLHGPRADHPAAHHAAADDEKNASGRHGPAAARLEDRADRLSRSPSP